MPLIRDVLNWRDWRATVKGEAGYIERQFALINPAHAAAAALRVSRRQIQQARKEGKTLESLAKENAATAAPNIIERLRQGADKRKATYEKRKKYPGERAADIHWFESFKAERLRQRPSVVNPEKMVGGHHTPEDYERGRQFANRHQETEAEFLKYVPEYPGKKGTARRKSKMSRESVLRQAARSQRRATRNNGPKKKRTG